MRSRSWYLSPLLLALGCPSEEPPPPPAQTVSVAFNFPEQGAPSFLEVPFPMDIYRDSDGTLSTVPGLALISNASLNVDALNHSLDQMNGFGNTTGVFFQVKGGKVDPVSLSGAAFLVDIDPNSPTFNEVLSTTTTFDADSKIIALVPSKGTVLREGGHYAAVLTTAIKDDTGKTISVDPDLTTILGDTTNITLSPSATTASQLLKPVAENLVANGLVASVGEIAAITAYATQAVTQDLISVREKLDDPAEIPAPQIQFPDASVIFDTPEKLDALLGSVPLVDGDDQLGTDIATGIAHSHVGIVASGFFPSPQVQPDDENDSNQDEQFSYDANGAPVIVNPARDVPIYVVLPRADLHPMPATGYPVVIFQHGIGGDRTAIWGFANALCKAGFAVVAIDAVLHGSRSEGAVDLRNNIADNAAFTGDPNLPDGIAETDGGDIQIDFFEKLLNLGGVRDNFRQSVIDLMGVARLLREPTLDLSALGLVFNGEAARLDASRIYVFGSSLGGMMGTIFTAVEPSVVGAVLNVPGGGLLTDTFSGSASIGGPLIDNLGLLWALSEEFRFERDDPFMNLAQMVLEAGDPLLYARHLVQEPFVVSGVPSEPKNILMLEVVGDETVSNAGTEALAGAMGLQLAAPFYPGGVYPAGDTLGLAVCDTTVGECDGANNGVSAALTQYAITEHNGNITRNHGSAIYVPGFPFTKEDELFPLLSQPIFFDNPIVESVTAAVTFYEDMRDGVPARVVHLAPPVADFDNDGTVDNDDTEPTNPNVQ